MKKLLALVLTLAMVFAMVACAAPAAAPAAEPAAEAAPAEAAPEAAPAEAATPSELNIGVLVWKYDDTYGSTVRAAMEKYAKEYGDEIGIKINLEMQDAGDSMATQTDQATIMFAQGKDAIIVNLAEVAAGQTIVDIAKDSGTPYIFYNKEPTDAATLIPDNNSIFVGTTPREAGDMQGEILAELLEKNPAIDRNGDGVIQYLMFMGEPNNPEAIARSQYSVETAEKNGVKLEALQDTLVCNWDQQQAYDAMVPAIESLGIDKIEVVFVNNDMMGLGVVAALNNYDYNNGGENNIVVIGVDAVDSALESIKAGGMTATVKQDGDAMGKANIIIAVNGALGKPWLEGTGYELAADGYSVRIPYAKITE